jgi:hypothetical protein
MTRGTTTPPPQRRNRTIILPIEQEAYQMILNDAVKFRQWLMENYRCHPELFPTEMKHGFTFNGKRNHQKRELVVRRIRFSRDLCYTILPSFVMPYSMVLTEEVAFGLLLRQWNVPLETAIFRLCF